MKKLVLNSMLAITMAFASVSCLTDKDDVIVEQSQLPTASNSFLATHFKGVQVSKVEKDADSVDEYYEVHLANGMQVDFNQSGDWTEVDGDGKAIPTGFIPSKIVEYVSATYPNSAIEGIDKQQYGFEVDLLNGVELMFDKEGNYLRLKDGNSNGSDNGTTPGQSQLPASLDTFLATHFKGIQVSKVEKDVNSVDEYYEVNLANGMQVDFNQSGAWTEVDGNGKAIPTGFIPSKIVEYVTTIYSNTAIEGIDKQAEGFEVDLLNGTELLFDKAGNYVRVKD